MDSLKMNNTSIDDDCEDDISLTPSPSILFPSHEAVIQSVIEKFTPEEYKEKYMESGKIAPQRSTSSIVTEIKSLMSDDEKAKQQILECLSEHYPKDFLAHAIQENSSETVCASLNHPAMLDYIFKQCATDQSMKTKLCVRIQENVSLLDSIDSSTILDYAFTKANNDIIHRQKLFEKIEKLFANADSEQPDEEMDPVMFELLIKIFTKKLSKSQVWRLMEKRLK